MSPSAANASRWRGQPGHYEAWHLRLGDPHSAALAPNPPQLPRAPGGRSRCVTELWFVGRDPDGARLCPPPGALLIDQFRSRRRLPAHARPQLAGRGDRQRPRRPRGALGPGLVADRRAVRLRRRWQPPAPCGDRRQPADDPRQRHLCLGSRHGRRCAPGRLISCTPGATATPRRRRGCTATPSHRWDDFVEVFSRRSPTTSASLTPVISTGAVVAQARAPRSRTAPSAGWRRAPSSSRTATGSRILRGPFLSIEGEVHCALADTRLARPTATPTAAARPPTPPTTPCDRGLRCAAGPCAAGCGRRGSRPAAAPTVTQPDCSGRASRRSCERWAGLASGAETAPGRAGGAGPACGCRSPAVTVALPRVTSCSLNLGALMADDAVNVAETGGAPRPRPAARA